MSYYKLCGFVRERYFNTKKIFRTRNEAIRYAFKHHLPYNAQLVEEIFKTKHDVEYVCDDHIRFFISRHTV